MVYKISNYFNLYNDYAKNNPLKILINRRQEDYLNRVTFPFLTIILPS